MQSFLNITPEAYIKAYLNKPFIISTKTLAFSVKGEQAKGFNIHTKNFKQNFGYIIRLSSEQIYGNIVNEIRKIIEGEQLNNYVIIIEYYIGRTLETCILRGRKDELQDAKYVDTEDKPEILEIFLDVITSEGYKLEKPSDLGFNKRKYDFDNEEALKHFKRFCPENNKLRSLEDKIIKLENQIDILSNKLQEVLDIYTLNDIKGPFEDLNIIKSPSVANIDFIDLDFEKQVFEEL